MTNRPPRRAVPLVVAVLAAAPLACDDDLFEVGSPPGTVLSCVREPLGKLDVLFVIDNSVSMSAAQAGLAARFDQYVAGLEATPGGMPDVHIAVVSTDVGIGEFASGGCAAVGDDGRFRRGEDDACDAVDGAYLVDAPDGGGGRATNYRGTLAEAFACMATIGDRGCGFEQPLEAMRRALTRESGPDATGFLRADAVLAVVLLGDEDDCSASDPAVFDPSHDAADAAFGYLDSYRCFEFGVVCEPDAPREMPGDGTPVALADCRPRDDSPYLVPPSAYAGFLRDLKGDGACGAPPLLVTVMNGPPAPVQVQRGTTDADPELEYKLVPACEAGSGPAAPAVRLAAFAEAFVGAASFASICTDDLGPVLAAGAVAAGAATEEQGCLVGDLVDLEPARPGLQILCDVEQVFAPGTPGELRVALEPCDAGGAAPATCWRTVADPERCGDQPSRLRLIVERDGDGAAIPPDTIYLASCRI